MTAGQRVLLTGAGGHVGTGTLPFLREHFDLTRTDLHASDGIAELDLLDFPAVREAVTGMDAVVHMAIASRRAMDHLEPHVANDVEMQVNMMGTQHVFEAARQAGVKRVVYFSSMTVMLGIPEYERFERDALRRPNGLYACTKLFGEYLGEIYAKRSGLSVICLRLGQPVGLPGYEHDSALVLELAEHGLLTDMVDVAEGIRCALTAPGVSFKLVSLASASSNGRVDLSAAAEIGYRPSKRFTPQGMIDNPPQEISA